MIKTGIPGYFLPHVENFVQEKNGSTAALYLAANIERDSFTPIKHSISEDQLYRFISEAIRQTNESGIGLEVGKRFSVNSFGLLSRAIMSSKNVHSAAKLIERYSSIAFPLIDFKCFEQEMTLAFEIQGLSVFPDLNQIIVEAFFAASIPVLKLLTGNDISADLYTFAFAEPDYFSRVPKEITKKIKFDADRNQFLIRKKFTSAQLLSANPIDEQTTLQECELKLAEQQQEASLSTQVVDLIRLYLESSPTNQEIASCMNITQRTLRRRLAKEGYTYRDLLRQVREETAYYYLTETHLQIEQIAFKLGYQETSNFRAAFKNWTGMSPREWRKESA
ncbi:MAG: AraC family transcriptional regulator [Pseudomonadales bacterium]|nr:AraC family transcriptional regulator [Pseudomonadales bacterium]